MAMTPCLIALALWGLLPTAQAGLMEQPPIDAVRASLLLCDGVGDCQRDASWVEGLGIVDDEPLVLVELLVELDAGGWAEGVDQRGRFELGLATAREQAALGRWRAVEVAADDALGALEIWPGTVSPQDLFALSYLQGAARMHRGGDRGHEASFRQAAAVLGQETLERPTDDVPSGRAFIDEQRKLKVAGQGTLLLGLIPPETTVWIDGRPLEPDEVELALPPANHRVTALQADGVRTWKATVPVLGERTSRVVIDIPRSSSAAWVSQGLDQLFLTLQAPVEIEAMLAELCRRFDLAELRLLQVVQPESPGMQGSVELGPPSALRPKAAEGEEVDHGDGVPSTYEAQLAAELGYRQEEHVAEGERRLRVVFYDPATGHFQADGGTAVSLEGLRPRLRLGAAPGASWMLEQPHVGADLLVALRAGPLWVEGRLGAARAQEPYRLYPDWSDRWLYHLAIGPGWRRRDGPFVPSVALLGEAWVPVSVGGRLQAGANLCMTRGICAGLEAHGSLGGQGPGWGVALAVSQGM